MKKKVLKVNEKPFQNIVIILRYLVIISRKFLIIKTYRMFWGATIHNPSVYIKMLKSPKLATVQYKVILIPNTAVF